MNNLRGLWSAICLQLYLVIVYSKPVLSFSVAYRIEWIDGNFSIGHLVHSTVARTVCKTWFRQVILIGSYNNCMVTDVLLMNLFHLIQGIVISYIVSIVNSSWHIWCPSVVIPAKASKLLGSDPCVPINFSLYERAAIMFGLPLWHPLIRRMHEKLQLTLHVYWS